MPIEIVMPRLGWTMEEGSIVEWHKRDGDAVNVGEVLFSIESDKAVNEFESFDSGILRIPAESPAPGQKVPIGTLLAYLETAGEAPVAPAPLSAAASPAMTNPVAAAPLASLSPAAARSRTGLPAISPRARRIADERGIDWRRLTGSGRTGRIVERDVLAAAAIAEARPALASAPAAPVAPPARLAAETTAVLAQPLSNRRRLIAQRMFEASQTTAPVTLTTEADATRLVRLREEIKVDQAEQTGAGLVPSYTDLLARLVALALIEHPALNVALDGDTLIQAQQVNIGIAVDTDDGVMVPVVREVERRSVQSIARESQRLIEAARQRRITPDDLQGGTFTITNLGMFEIDAFTPIINRPECAILGVGRIVARPVVVDEASETVAVRRMMALSLTFDHRAVDGAPAARFLQRIKQFIERPTLWLTR